MAGRLLTLGKDGQTPSTANPILRPQILVCPYRPFHPCGIILSPSAVLCIIRIILILCIIWYYVLSNPAPRTALPYPCVSSRPRWRVSDDVLFLCPSERCTKASANGTNTHQLSIYPPTIPDLPPGLQLKRHARLALRIYNDPPVSRPSCTLTPIPTVLHDGSILQRIDLSCTTVACTFTTHRCARSLRHSFEAPAPRRARGGDQKAPKEWASPTCR